MVISQIIREGIKYAIRSSGAGLIPKGYRAYRKFDVQSTTKAFGRSGGKGYRHGRDLGLILGGEYLSGGDDLDEFSEPPSTGTPSYKQPQAYNRYKRSGNRRSAKYNRYCYPKRSSKYY